MSFRNDYKKISSFYKNENENIKSSCLKDFERRIENSNNDIKNIGDINKINARKTPMVENFTQSNFYTPNMQNLKTDIPYMENMNFNIQPNFYRSNTQNNLKTDISHMKNMNFNTVDNNSYNNENFEMSYTRKKYKSTSSPDVFGPPLWFTLHNGASKYPHKPGNLVKERMKYFILGIPVMIPCAKCREDATAYIEKFKDSLDDICSSRMKLFEFFFTFHNVVNKKLNKPIMSYEDAIKLYSDDVEVNKLTY
jgi:hypothetical protein